MQLKIGFQFPIHLKLIRKAELTALNTKTITPGKHLEPLNYLLENNYFHEDARECILSILSVLEVGKIQTKSSAKQEKNSKTQKNILKGQTSVSDIFQTKQSEDEKLGGESNKLKDVAVVQHSSEESNEDGSTSSDSGGSLYF